VTRLAIRILLLAAWLQSVAVSAAVEAEERPQPGLGPVWHASQAFVRYRIEADPNWATEPDVYLSDLGGVSDVRQAAAADKDARPRPPFTRISGMVYMNGILRPGAIARYYDIKPEYGCFSAVVGVDDRADESVRLVFEVYIDRSLKFSSGELSRHDGPRNVNVPLPAGSRQLKVAIRRIAGSRASQGTWANAGFVLRSGRTSVAQARICTIGVDSSDCDIFVYGAGGGLAKSKVIGATRGDALQVLFETGASERIYYVYLVRKDIKRQQQPWEPDEGLILETRVPARRPNLNAAGVTIEKALADAPRCIGACLVDSVQQGAPMHVDGSQGMRLYYYSGHFAVETKGDYIFATVSDGPSYIYVDGQLIEAWPGGHGIGGGARGQQQASVPLAPGKHRFEYLNYNQSGRMFAVAAWQKPGQTSLHVMSRGDFGGIVMYNVTAIRYRPGEKSFGGFEYETTDDVRSTDDSMALVMVAFRATRPETMPAELTFRWRFDDGITATGQTTVHVFMKPGRRRVSLETLRDGRTVGQVGGLLNVQPLWQRWDADWSGLDDFRRALRETDLKATSRADIMDLYRIGCQADVEEWRQKAARELARRQDDIISDPQDVGFAIELADYLQSPGMQEYKAAMQLYRRISQHGNADVTARDRAALAHARMLVECYGDSEGTVRAIADMEARTGIDDSTRRMMVAVKAEGLVGAGKLSEAQQSLAGIRIGSTGIASADIRNAGLLAKARSSLDSGEASQFDYAMGMLDDVLAGDPRQMMSGEFNLIRMNLLLARREYQRATVLGQWILKLKAGDYYDAEALACQVKAYCCLAQIDDAKAAYERLAQEYPSSSAKADARKAIAATAESAR
jgi:hypothetical protein